jgi:uncharacterized protein YndB with AHSA1/START domain
MLIYIAAGLVVAIGALVLFIAARPGEFRISRSALIPAPAQAVYDQVIDLHHWDSWSPWAKLAPAAAGSYEGPPAGVGSSLAWSGNRQVGQGRMTIIDAQPNERIRIRLDFVKPFRATNTCEFTFKPEGGQTLVTWIMFGRNTFPGKAMGLLIHMDKMLGGQFEQGLESLKHAVAAAGTPP